MQDDIGRKTRASDKTIGGTLGLKAVDIERGTYKIYSNLDYRMLVDMSLTANADGTHNVKLYRDTNALESTWFIDLPAYRDFEISNKRNESLKLAKARSDNDYNAVADPAPDDDRDQWYFADAGSGVVYIINEPYRSALEVMDDNAPSNANIALRPFNGEDQQKFRLMKL
ncbi:hypothetical protein CD58_27635 [Pseudomonas brassicacearum]|uniref:RICIN domain-containing protein n=1 Tax=Pseudomonas brassicacearum TaxID=930166 RepID=UPI00042E3319|nr:RICIN domain-containing protein [Pseudomonas brassicacearum]AHL36946.1 hypothetical protein CD58_27635 [Pseudomonas brassicacearum]